MCCRISYTKVSHSSAPFSGALSVTSSEGVSLRVPRGQQRWAFQLQSFVAVVTAAPRSKCQRHERKNVHELDYIGTLSKPGCWTNTISDILLLCSALKLWRPLTSSQKILPRALSELYKVCKDSGQLIWDTVTYQKTKQLP